MAIRWSLMKTHRVWERNFEQSVVATGNLFENVCQGRSFYVTQFIYTGHVPFADDQNFERLIEAMEAIGVFAFLHRRLRHVGSGMYYSVHGPVAGLLAQAEALLRRRPVGWSRSTGRASR